MIWLASIVDILFQVYMLMLFVRILSSWMPQLMEYKFMQFIAFYTDPYLNLFRRIVPPLGMFDLSPILAFFSISILKDILIFLMQ
jgi:YggT family protein